jgi:allophanate hydrolase subunit 1
MTNGRAGIAGKRTAAIRSFGIGDWSFIGHWSLVIGHWSFAFGLWTKQ